MMDPRKGLERVAPPDVEGLAGAGSPRPFAATRAYALADLERDRNRILVSLADLPNGHGMGTKLDELLGGGLGPGEVLALGAAGAGAGKTAFAMQIADGLALRSAALLAEDRPGPLTPTVLVSEMPPDALARRTLARLVDAPASVFRSGVAAESWTGWDPDRVDRAYAKARRELDPGGAFARMAEWQRVARPGSRGAAMLAELADYVGRLRDEFQAEHGREVWPVVVIDPIQRWQSEDASEVEALNVLCEELDRLADDGRWIALVTSDTNKSSAVDASRSDAKEKDSAPPSAAAMFRGSYKLFHSADSVLVLRPDPFDKECPSRRVVVELAKNRNGPAWGRVDYTWAPARGLFSESRIVEA